jgi:hypothetical protein
MKQFYVESASVSYLGTDIDEFVLLRIAKMLALLWYGF